VNSVSEGAASAGRAHLVAARSAISPSACRRTRPR